MLAAPSAAATEAAGAAEAAVAVLDLRLRVLMVIDPKIPEEAANSALLKTMRMD